MAKIKLNPVLAKQLDIPLPDTPAAATKFRPVPGKEIQPANGFDEDGLLFHKENDRLLLIGYLSPDETSPNYWEFFDDSTLLDNLADQEELKKKARLLTEQGTRFFQVGIYPRRQQQFFILNPQISLESLSDVTHDVGLFIPADDMQRMHPVRAEQQGTEEADRWLLKTSDNILNDYSKWAAGKVYGIIVEHWKRLSASVRRVDMHAAWGYVGLQYALKSLHNEMDLPFDSKIRRTPIPEQTARIGTGTA